MWVISVRRVVMLKNSPQCKNNCDYNVAEGVCAPIPQSIGVRRYREVHMYPVLKAILKSPDFGAKTASFRSQKLN